MLHVSVTGLRLATNNEMMTRDHESIKQACNQPKINDSFSVSPENDVKFCFIMYLI